tara:strand:+ start:532 stop:873 length:342 start_codon:yes stop_codon:yes gene_type:complete
MAISPGTYNMIVQRRSDHAIDLQFKDSNNTPINLTGFTVAAQVWEETRTVKYADFNVTYSSRTDGKVNIALTDTQTTTFGIDKLKYDVLLTNPSGLKEYYLEGDIKMVEGYTT